MLLVGGIMDQGPGQLGGKAIVGPNAGPGATEQLTGTALRLEARDKSKSQNFVLSFDAKPIRASANPVNNNHIIHAQIIWGSPKGNGNTLIDVKHGTRVTLEGTSCSVNLFYSFTDEAGFGRIGPDYEVFCSVAGGSVGKGPQLTFTGLIIQAVGVPDRIDIPDYAREIEFQSTSLVGQPITFDFLTANAAGARVISTRNLQFGQVTIPNGAEAIEVTNAAGGNTTFIYHLSL